MLSFFACDQCLLDGLANQLVAIDTSAIVRTLDHNLIALMVSVEANRSICRFAGRESLLWCLDAVIHTIAYEMRKRFRECVKNAFIEIGLLAMNLQVHFLSAGFGHVAYYAWKATEELFHRH